MSHTYAVLVEVWIKTIFDSRVDIDFITEYGLDVCFCIEEAVSLSLVLIFHLT